MGKTQEKEKFTPGDFIKRRKVGSLVTGSTEIILSSFLQRGVGLSRHFPISAADKPVSDLLFFLSSSLYRHNFTTETFAPSFSNRRVRDPRSIDFPTPSSFLSRSPSILLLPFSFSFPTTYTQPSSRFSASPRLLAITNPESTSFQSIHRSLLLPLSSLDQHFIEREITSEQKLRK